MDYKRILWVILILSLISVSSGCDFLQKDVKMKSFEHKDAGFSFNVPDTWKMVEKDENKVVFKAEEEPVTMYVREEIGGMALYSPDEVAKMVAEEFKDFMENVKVTRDSFSYSMGQKAYRLVIHGKINDADYQAKVFVREQDLGIRHYLIFISPKEFFYGLDFVTEDIAKSFKLTSEDVDYYKRLSPHYKKEEKLEEIEKNNSESKDKVPDDSNRNEKEGK